MEKKNETPALSSDCTDPVTYRTTGFLRTSETAKEVNVRLVNDAGTFIDIFMVNSETGYEMQLKVPKEVVIDFLESPVPVRRGDGDE